MRIFTLTILILTITLSAFAQNNEKYEKYKSKYKYSRGYIITRDSVKIEGVVKDNLLNGNFSIVIFVTKDGVKSKYRPGDLLEFRYLANKFVSDGDLFYQIIQNGSNVSLYLNVSTQTTMGGGGMGAPPTSSSTSQDNYYVKRKSEDTFIPVKRSDFGTIFSAYFSDCETLRLKIENKEYKHIDIKEIVREYNSCN